MDFWGFFILFKFILIKVYAMNEFKYEKNIRIYYGYMASFQLLIGPIVMLYLLQKGLNFTQVMTLQSIFSIGVVILEVPTGAVGDLIGRKTSMCLAGIAMILGIVVYINSTMFYQFILGEILLALGMCLKSGSDTALLYDTLKILNRTDEYTKFQGKGQAFFLSTQIVGSIIAGFVYDINVELPMILSIIVMSISVIIALFFKEVPIHEHIKKPSYIVQITESAKYLVNHKKVRAIVLYGMFFFIFYRVGFWYYQPYFVAVNIDTKYFGIIFGVFNGVATVSALFADKFIKYTKGKSLIMLSVLLFVSFLVLGVTKVPIGVIFILLQQIARGVNIPTFMKYMNKHIESHHRATIISFNSLLKNLAAAIAFPFVGFMMDNMDIFTVNLFSSLLIGVGIIFFYVYLKSSLKASKKGLI